MASNLLLLKNRLSHLNNLLSRYEGEVNSLNSRKDILAKSVGAAKGRLAHKATVDAFLEELQAEAHAKRVGDFEKLLTALVSEVLPEEAPIGLDLEIERGQPSLDIVSRHSADRSEDIFDDQGGALTNVVSLGLRMIAVVRSGMNRFLLLDESDCWVSNNRVPAFYSVLKEAARKINIQCLAISHHDISGFGGGIETATLTGHPSRMSGVRIENNPKRYQWKDDEPGIRWIRLKNFQGYVDETVHLTPGVNALVGENNIGKSSFVRAFRAVFYGESRDSLIRHGERQCSVEIGFSHGRVLHWNRQIRRNPINLWRFQNCDGSIVSEEGITYESGGRTPPEWVTNIFKIGPVEGMDIHAIKQKEPVFLLNKPGSVRAAVLSVGQESGHIRKMIALHKEQSNTDSSTVKNGEIEMNSILERLSRLSNIEEMKKLGLTADHLLAETDRREILSTKLQHAETTITTSAALVKRQKKIATSLQRLLTVDDIKRLDEDAANVAKAADVVESIASATRKVETGYSTARSLAGLPYSAPQLADITPLVDTVESIDVASRRLLGCKAIASTMTDLPMTAPRLKEVEPLEQTIAHLQHLGNTTKKIRISLGALKSLPSSTIELKDVSSLEQVVSDMLSSSKKLEASQISLSALTELPNTPPQITRSDELIKAGKSILDSNKRMSGLSARGTTLSKVPNLLLELNHADELSNVLGTIINSKTALYSVENKNNEVEGNLASISDELNQLVASMGHQCPLCSHVIENPSAILGHNDHIGCSYDEQ